MSFLVKFFSVLVLISSILVISSVNPLHSVLFLISSFLFSSLVIFLLENEFLALFFLIIYLGAIAVLFLFIVMMLDIKYHDLQTSKLYFPMGLFIGSTVFFEIWGAFNKMFYFNANNLNFPHNIYVNWYDSLDSITDIYVLGQTFYTHYALQILIAGLILYLAVIGVAFLTIKTTFIKSSKKEQSIFRQLARKNVL